MVIEDEEIQPPQAGRPKIPGGAMSVLAQLGLLFYSADNVSKKQFLDISHEAAADCRTAGDTSGAGFIEGLCKRLE
jgi:hypothetical protein